MGGKMSRAKGQRGEREVIGLLQPIVNQVYDLIGKTPPELARNLSQYQKKGNADIRGLEWLALEIKFQEQSHLEDWWKQTVSQCTGEQLPVLMHRATRQSWKVRTIGFLHTRREGHAVPVDISLESFLAYFRMLVKEHAV